MSPEGAASAGPLPVVSEADRAWALRACEASRRGSPLWVSLHIILRTDRGGHILSEGTYSF